MPSLKLLPLLLILPGVSALLSNQIILKLPKAVSYSSHLFGIRCEDKFYQLEENEDIDNCRTEVYLLSDRTVDFGKTDGPVPESVEGVWDIVPGTDDFIMTIRKCFSTGKSGSDMGEFAFEIIREFKGDMAMVGESVSITGVIINKDELLGDKGKPYAFFFFGPARTNV
jgi:hypothetical protein